MSDKLFDLTGKVILVTGGSRGLGYQMVKAFAERDADLIIASRKLDACETVAEEVRALGRRAMAVACHVGKWAEVERLVDVVYAEFGRIDVLVNNAGMSPAVPSHEVTEELFDKVLGLNFKGPFRLSALVAQRMAAGEGGSIINISSTGGIRPSPQIVPYAGAKAALNAMTVGLAQEYGPTVRVNTISAGPFLTDIAKAWTEDMRQSCANALGRPGQPEEIITTALYLASPYSTYTTSSLIKVDGGLP
ncbi:short-chain dehydrogenase [Pseudomonas taiwanensis]|uniref:SDR family NAD(P)-dependent oxidoreductase n=1 Tax=Pseudomonas taiwanensis TaxID=470150 RepID=UPI0015BEF45D|nr:SDR family oxidoreductase [Pseudomonas taiwanensis]NWL80983.1 short-chain dehydrogenase [Pseudomonas taiwanensis]